MDRTKVFLSAATAEFKGCRQELEIQLYRGGWIIPRVQEALAPGGPSTLLKLGQLIAHDVDIVVHLVGQHAGSPPTGAAELKDLSEWLNKSEASRARLHEFLHLVGLEGEAAQRDVPYTYWEAYLAWVLRKDLLVLEPGAGFGPMSCAAGTEDARRRDLHLDRLRQLSAAYKPEPVADLDAAVKAITRLEDEYRSRGAGLPAPPGSPEVGSSPGPAARDAAVSHHLLTPPDLDHNYFGYEDEGKSVFGAIKRLLFAPRAAGDRKERAIAVWGIPGIGKSSLLRFLREDADVHQHFQAGVLAASLGEEANPYVVQACLANWVVEFCDTSVQSDTLPVQQKSRDLLKRTLAQRPGERLLIVVDDVWDPELAKTLKLSDVSCSYVFTTRPEGYANDLALPGHALQLEPLSPDDSLRLVSDISGYDQVLRGDAPLIARIGHWVREHHGLPLALERFGRTLKSLGRDRKAMARFLDELETLQQAGALVEEASLRASFNCLAPDARKALVRLAALRPDPGGFDAGLAVQVIGDERLFSAVVKASGLIRQVSEPRAIFGAGRAGSEGESIYTLHRVHVDWLLQMLPPEAFREVSDMAARYTSERITRADAQAGEQSEYDAWFRFEDPAWHALMFELRYYLERAGRYRELVFVLTNAWIMGFWWWDCYGTDESDFCRRLLEDWPGTPSGQTDMPAPDILQAGADLRTLQAAYVEENAADRRAAVHRDRWVRVREMLDRILHRVVHEAPDHVRGGNQQTDLLGLLSIFKAESWRFGAGDASQALRHYRDAIQLFSEDFEEDPKRWNLNWSQMHLAEALYDFGIDQDADRQAEIVLSQEYHQVSPDHEVLSRACMVRAALLLAHGDAGQAADFLSRAVLFAYRFQAYMHFNVGPEAEFGPDGYTVVNYADTRNKAVRLLLDARWRATALEAAPHLLSGWHEGPAADARLPLVRLTMQGSASGDDPVGTLAGLLFPAPMDAADLEKPSVCEAYASEVRQALLRLEQNILPAALRPRDPDQAPR